MTGSRSPRLRSAGGLFILDQALLLARDEPEDVEHSHAIHEYAHAAMLAGSEYYAAYAARVIVTGRTELTDDAIGFIEALPNVFRHFGGRPTPGTQPEPRAVEELVKAVQLYRRRFRASWGEGAIEKDPLGLDQEALFDRTVANAVAQSALDCAERNSGSAFFPNEPRVQKHAVSALELVENLNKRLTKVVNTSDLPGGQEMLFDHIARLIQGPRQIVRWFASQIELGRVLANSDPETLIKHAVLLPAIVRLEFLVDARPSFRNASFFAHETYYYRYRLSMWATRVAGHPHRPGVLNALGPLCSCFMPVRIKDRIAIPAECADQTAVERMSMVICWLSIREFFRRLPGFLDWYMDRNLEFFEGHRSRLKILAESSDAIAHGYFRAIEQEIADFAARQPDAQLANIETWYRLVPSHHQEFGDIYEIALNEKRSPPS
jgi:hypothetical protein